MRQERVTVGSGMLRIPRILLACLFAATSLGGAELEKEMATVESVRKLKFERPVAQKTIARKDLRKFLMAQLEKDLPIPLDDYLRALDALELIEKKPDTLDSFLGLYDAQVLAFYDPSTHVYYSLSDPPKGTELDEMMSTALVIHELSHALQDQRFNAGEKILAMRGDTEAQLAYQSVLEGEAMLVMLAALLEPVGLSLEAFAENDELMSSMAALSSLNPGIPENAPRFFVESMKFPYLDGLRFVAEAYRRGGWAGVDALHRKPPASTEQILHPDSYFDEKTAGAPAMVKPEARKTLLTERMGEFGWRFLLGDEAAAGWGGDAVQIVQKGVRPLDVFIETIWDTELDARQFAAAYRRFLSSRSIKPEILSTGRKVSVSYSAR